MTMTASSMPMERPNGGYLVRGFFYWAFIIAIACLVLTPVILLLEVSFNVGPFGGNYVFGWDHWLRVFTSQRLLTAVWNTLTLSLGRQSIALVVGIALAWLLARSNLPGRSWIEVGFWIAMFMPALPVAMAWILLAGGRSGLINIGLHWLIPALPYPLFNIYSWGGIVWVHLVTSTIPIKVFLLAPAFRNLDSSLEESSRASGSGLLKTIRRIVIPLMLPIIVISALIGIVRAMQSFEIELILGMPASIDVYSTVIYSAMKQEPPLYGPAGALSILFVAGLLPFILLQKWYSRAHAYGTLGGRFTSQVQNLGPWKWPIFALVMLLLFLMTVLPALMITLGTFMKLFGDFNLPNPWTLAHWQEAFSSTELTQSLLNTLELGLSAAAAGMVVYSVIAYITVKRFAGGQVLDLLTWIPSVIPGIVMSMGVLEMFLQLPILRPIYGTMWALTVAVLIGAMTIGTQVVRGTLLQLSNELEEASWMSGAGRLRTFFRIVLPLVMPSIVVVGLNVFGTAVSVVGLIVLLGTGPNQPLSVLQLTYLDSGHFEPATVIGLFILGLAALAAIAAKIIGSRFALTK